MFEKEKVYNEELLLNLSKGIQLIVKREDLLHPEVSGNKFRKLKYNIAEAKRLGYSKLLTFGGAYSNHIAATAAAGRILGLQTIGVIRGEELKTKYKDNPTLFKAEQDGMLFEFVTRTQYREKSDLSFVNYLKQVYGDFYLVPEGGTNELAIRGTEEILKEEDKVFDYICCAAGTGGTVAGIINASTERQQVLGFPALKGDFLFDEIRKYTNRTNWDLILDYHFGGYGKVTQELIDFLLNIEKKTGVLFDPIYNGKMLFGVLKMIEQDKFPENSKILLIHSGGLQGWNDIIKGE
ncbi:1-aminocyclopropane-1-carboxylate deaminase/D-cysteine desulfhydrase [Myroides sp. LoEW2-1]|uniref:1-aminocyclopropane-1-carboxylate deaminase/D-cysteine desulfhydrase n=1 Tax=Myroides sp. LoEW2-1 TaxID=2683192 RepID=UPI001323F85F|nr:pyridoxal-phosphate dependent enzyme [Myroides sp. LoEW2-1]MVX35490.1 pyridoxal-phosphate dependent enzyme [Myroides sp. LoEW2-1]